jgi:hypothetical protein
MSGHFTSLLILLASSLFAYMVKADETYQFIGKVDYSRQQLVTSTVEGILDKVHVRSGTVLNNGQQLIDITPFDPNMQQQKVINRRDNLVVSEVLVREGEMVHQYQRVMRLNSKDDMQIRGTSYFPISQSLFIGQTIEVIFDPDGEPYQLLGKIDALHNHVVQHGKMSTVEVEIGIDNQTCFKDSICNTHFKIGSFVKLQFTRSNDSVKKRI